MNTRLLLKGQIEGIGRFTHEIFSRLVKNHPEHEFHFIFDRPFDPEFVYAENVTTHVVFPPVRHALLAVIWFDFQLRKKVKAINPDVFISTDSMNMLRPVCKTISVVHDVNFELFPKMIPFFLRKYYQYRTPIISEKSDVVVTVSEFSKKSIMETYQLAGDRIKVVYNAAGEDHHPVDENTKKEIKRKISKGKEYFIFVGGLYHRKNLVNLLKAFEIFKEKSNSDIKLVLIGRKVKDADELISLAEHSKYKDDIQLMGRMDNEGEVKKIMASALALTCVSVNEGFGIPLVEAMKSGIPIIASDNSSIPEVVGEAALFVDPFNVEDIAEKMKILCNDRYMQLDLAEKSLIQSKKFDWEKSASSMMKILEEVGTT